MVVRELITRFGFQVNEGSLKKGEAKLQKFKSRMATAGKVVGASLIALGGLAVKAASDTEMLTTNFEVMLGSAEKAQDMMTDLKKFASTTPFALNDLAKGTQNLIAMGVAADNSVNVMRMLGDTSGGNTKKLNGLVLAYGKVQAKGKASMEEINMMAERGVPILKTLQSQLSVNEQQLFKMISAGKIGRQEIKNAFRSMTSESGMFFKGMEKQSLTFAGIVSTMKDNFASLAGEIGNKLLPVVSKIVLKLTELAQGKLGQLLQSVFKQIEPILDIALQLIEQIFTLTDPVTDILEVLFNMIGDLGGLLKITEPLINLIVKVLQFLAKVIMALEPVFKPVFSLLLELISEIVDSISDDLIEIMKELLPLFVMFAQILVEILPLILLLTKAFIKGLSVISKGISFIIKIVLKLLQVIFAVARANMKIFGNLVRTVVNFVNNIVNKFQKLPGRILKVINTIKQFFIAGFTKMVDGVETLLNNILTFLSPVIDAFQSFANFIESIFEIPIDVVKGLWNGLLKFIQNAINKVFEGVNFITDKLRDLGIDLPNLKLNLPALELPSEIRKKEEEKAARKRAAQDAKEKVKQEIQQRQQTIKMQNEINTNFGGTGIGGKAAAQDVAKIFHSEFQLQLRNIQKQTRF